MKKNALQMTLAALLVLCGNVYAQKITIGAKGGISIPNLTGGSTDNPLNSGYSSRLGADGGIYAEYHLNKKFSISVGMEYSSQGGLKDKLQAFPDPYVSSSYLYANFKSEAKLDYFLVPVLARYSWKLSRRSPLRIYAALGPFAGYLLRAHQVTSGSSMIYADPDGTTPLTSQEQSFDGNVDIKDQLYTFNAGINGFVGISYNLTRKHAFFIEGGGNYGFLSIQKGEANGKNYTGAGVLTLGYSYTFQKQHRGWGR